MGPRARDTAASTGGCAASASGCTGSKWICLSTLCIILLAGAQQLSQQLVYNAVRSTLRRPPAYLDAALVGLLAPSADFANCTSHRVVPLPCNGCTSLSLALKPIAYNQTVKHILLPIVLISICSCTQIYGAWSGVCMTCKWSQLAHVTNIAKIDCRS